MKPADPADPVFDGATGTIGDPVATALEPDPTPEPVATPELIAVPVAMGAVPVANPVEPATPVELGERISMTAMTSKDMCSVEEEEESLPNGSSLSARADMVKVC